ncbi:GNAT family N-acetyltransferase [Streptomyces sp. NPDC005805]|uniref:GNAT family N-acetyltransferase n=1 Tax=Streptomyces sp. NPDC005805 TaxID=3157068 RepID=UPI0033DA9F0A
MERRMEDGRMDAQETADAIVVRGAGEADRAVLQRLWQLFRHDLAAYQGGFPPGPGGLYGTERLDAAFGNPDRALFLFLSGPSPVGFALVRVLDGGGAEDGSGSGPASGAVLSAFFVVRGLRRGGVGMRAVREVLAAHPGRWEIPFQEANTGAARFWRRVAEGAAPGAWTEEPRGVPVRLGVPPDRWIAFRAGSGGLVGSGIRT